MTNPGWGGAANEGTPPQPRCVRHPDRPTALSCNRCGRPACPECLREAAVGYQCVDCVAAGQRDVRQVRNVAGAVTTQRAVPLVTYILMAVNVGIFLITAAQSRSIMQNQAGSKLFADWALFPPAVVDGQIVRVLGSGFLHFGIIHLAVNMFALWVIGRDTELVLGRARYACVYFVSLLGGSAAVMLFQLGAVTAGASGAVFGLMGAQAVILLRLRRSPAPVISVIAVNVIISITIPGISLWGHLGGLVAGAAATAGILYGPQLLGAGNNREKAITVGWICLGVVVLVPLAVIAVRTLQLRASFGY
ncbi:rhomboid family protein [Rhodococcus opacus PD630]|uniref:Rhomboid family intramembrane serine protease n=2 Tax=Rhodococcus opacus TaxID=37919 RepID=A0AAX3YGW5_RHOOP|nr:MULTISPECIES: rhomboid family intramembrane serine protease [Rhodococcus]KXF50559.1 rhomboid family intramembrane serine protease [Rhodococcus sp. SC4]AHK27275.1 Rhomboid-like protease 3 [Rhodococcus opacus PD630]EHI41465.1 rhomboid family protein [Rhodococcus opacus PD630]EKT77861.1 rhomboid family protein [Rhodococcus opacus M213]MBA8961013.1 membrane associated rhomboid family serine protease [Rhodococcus opacus]